MTNRIKLALAAALAATSLAIAAPASAGNVNNTAHCDYVNGNQYGGTSTSPNSSWGYASLSGVDYVYGRQLVNGHATTTGFRNAYLDHVRIWYSDGVGNRTIIFPDNAVRDWASYFPAGASHWILRADVCYM